MKRRRFKSAMRFLLQYVREGLMWLGQSHCMCPPFDMSAAAPVEATRARPMAWSTDVPERPDQSSMTPLSEAEHAEWATLVKRLG